MTRRPPPALCPRDETCPNVHSHDTYSAHKYGCRSPAAIADRHRYEKQISAGLYPHRILDARPYARRLQALAARGWRGEDIAAHSTLGRSQTMKVLVARHPWITQPTARAVDAVFRELWWRDGPSDLARVRAVNRGWVVAACWDDIDNMDEKPKTGKRRDRTIPGQHRGEVLDRRAHVARLHGEGNTLQEISWTVGITERTVSRHLAAIAAGDTGEAMAS